MAAPPMAWQDIQQNTFTRWCNDYLRVRGLFVNDLKKDLSNGLVLINLLEVISGKSLGKYNRHPKIVHQKGENLNIALEFIKKEGLKLVNIGSEDIMMGNLRAILGLLWTLILRYEIKGNHESNDSAANDLLEWVRSKIPEYNIKNFTSDWNDGRAVCALVDALRPGLIPHHRSMKPEEKLANATLGIDTAEQRMLVDKLILPEEMTHPKVDKLAMMTYIAQFRNLLPVSDASRCMAHGPGLVEGVVNQDGKFSVLVPKDVKGKLEVKVVGPHSEAKVDVIHNDDGTYNVSYKPTEPGSYEVHVTLDGQHIPGSIFRVLVLATISLGGEGKIRVYFSTTSASEKYKHDKIALTNLLQGKKVHLRSDFEPWQAVDMMDKDDREAVFTKAGTRTLPIVFIDDVYVGDYDKLAALNEEDKLDALLNMSHANLVSEEEHFARLKLMDPDLRKH